jgi:hypothetical protein
MRAAHSLEFCSNSLVLAATALNRACEVRGCIVTAGSNTFYHVSVMYRMLCLSRFFFKKKKQLLVMTLNLLGRDL